MYALLMGRRGDENSDDGKKRNGLGKAVEHMLYKEW